MMTKYAPDQVTDVSPSLALETTETEASVMHTVCESKSARTCADTIDFQFKKRLDNQSNAFDSIQ